MNLKDDREKLQLEYPCEWNYKIIGFNQDGIQSAISEIIATKPYRVTFSNKSKKGKYLSLSLDLTVESEAERNAIYTALKNRPEIKMVL